MNDAHDEVAARRLDWGLAENEGGSPPPDLVAKVLARAAAAERSEARRPARLRRWLTAATVLLALGAVVGVRMLACEPAVPSADAPAQDPAAVEIEVTSAAEADRLPPDARAVVVRNQTDDVIETVVRRCPDLASLAILHFKGPATSATDRALAHVAKLTKLRHLQVRKVPGITGAGLRELERLPMLEELLLNDLSLADDALDLLPRLPSLRVLDLSATEGIGSRGMAAIAGCTLLRRLVIPRCEGLLADDWQGLAALIHLEVLVAHRVHCSLDGLRLDRAARLHTIDLQHAQFTQVFLEHLPASLTTLRCEGRSLDDAGCAILRDRLHLRELSVRASDIGHGGLAALLDMPSLESLDLTFTIFLDSPRIDLERTIGQLAASPTLRVVTLSPAPYLAELADRLFAAGIDVRLGSPPRDDLETTLAALRERHADAIAARAARTTRTPR